MTRSAFVIAYCVFVASHSTPAVARVWTDSTGQYTLDADLVTFNHRTVVLKRADHEMVAIPIETLSNPDREFLKSKEAEKAQREIADAVQTWTLRDGTKITGQITDYARRDVTIQRRRGRMYVNDRVLGNLPEFYQQLLPQIVAHFEALPRADRRALDEWLLRQGAQPRNFHLEGVIIESENGNEYAVPFFLFTEGDAKLLKPGWNAWLATQTAKDYSAGEDQAFLLRSLAAALQSDRLIQREIALMQLKLQAVQAGITSLWEVTLYPGPNSAGPPQWVVVPGRDSRQATIAALEQFPGSVVGPIRRVSR